MNKTAGSLFLIVMVCLAGCGGDAADPSSELSNGSVVEAQNRDAAEDVRADESAHMSSGGTGAAVNENDAASGVSPREAASKRSGAADDHSVPSSPSGLFVDDYGSTTVILCWQASSCAEWYNVYRAAGLSETYEKVNAETITGTTWADAGLEENTRYFYRVSAVNASGESGQSSAVSQKTANPLMSYVRFCNLGSVGIAGMRLGRSWFRPVNTGELTSYVEALPGLYFFEYWNTETFEWEAVSAGMFTLQPGRRYTVRDTDTAAFLETDDVLKREDTAVFIENMSTSKTAASPAHLSK